MSQPHLTKPAMRHRSGSSVGRIDLGDSIPGLYGTKESREESHRRMIKLSSNSQSDMDLFVKIWLSFREMNYRHAWLAPLMIMIVVYTAYISSGNLTETNPLHKFVAISYQVEGTNMYGKGIKDLCFVFYYMIFFTFFREFILDVVIRPLPNLLNVKSNHKSKRIKEQTFYVIYYTLSSPFGIYIMYHSDLWWFKTAPMYRTYPDFNNSYLFKLFYLGQAAFWAQQSCVLTLQLEKPRKDHKEMIFHHVVTLLLVWLSYVFHFTKMGLPIYISMDVSDLLLSYSKIFNYLDSPLTPYVFFIFATGWAYTRHYLNMKILWSVLTEFRTVGEYRLNFAVQQYKCWISLPIVFTLIGALQLVQLYWFFLILRIAYRITFKGVTADDRSDEEDESGDIEETEEDESIDSKTTAMETKKED